MRRAAKRAHRALGVKGRGHTRAQRRRWPRRYAWSFASGHATPLRDAATALLQTAELPGSHSLVYAQSGAAPVGEDEYSRVLGNSIFALAPTGNVAETWRLTEALDAGAIPILTGDSAHFRSAGYPPVLVDLFVDVGSLSHRIRRARKLTPSWRGPCADAAECARSERDAAAAIATLRRLLGSDESELGVGSAAS